MVRIRSRIVFELQCVKCAYQINVLPKLFHMLVVYFIYVVCIKVFASTSSIRELIEGV